MKKDEMFTKLKEAHQRYVDWWLPIDVASGSLMAPMSCHRFCETLLVNDFGYTENIKNWWNEWMIDFIEPSEKIKMKRLILQLIISHYLHLIDLNNDKTLYEKT